jgi:CRISPR system Cascade subunit CasB
MWPFYTTLRADGRVSADLRAEHVALTLFAVHQQSRPRPMHRHGIGVGSALLALRRDGKFSPEAVDRRVSAAATATSLAEAAVHLRGLITQLRGIDHGLDYDQLFRDLRDWQFPDRVAAIRRRWGGQYFAPAIPSSEATPADAPS